MKLNKVLKLQSALVLALAQDLNFYGKKLRDKRIECAENILDEMQQQIGTEIDAMPSDLVTWLDENKPAKPAKADKPAKAATKPAANTLIGSTSKKTIQSATATGSQRYLVTAAQNNTAVNREFWEQFTALAAELGAKIIVLPLHYNLNAFSPAVADQKEYFDPLVVPFLQLTDCWLFQPAAIKLLPEAAVLPTAKLPVNAASALNAGELFSIVPHTKQQLRTLPRMLDQPIRQAWTTGAATIYNYTKTRAGAEAEADHVFGGLLVSTDSDTQAIHCTNIRMASNGKIEGAIMRYTDHYGFTLQPFASLDTGDQPAIKLGDLHCEVFDPVVWSDTLKILRDIDPAVIAVDDIIHFSTMSHHQRHNATHLYRSRNESVHNDLKQVIRQLNELAELAPVVYVTESNHNSAVDQWIADSGFKAESSPQNAKIYHLIKWMLCEAIDEGRERPAYELALKSANLSGLPELSDRVIFGRMDQPYIVNGYDFSQHGHKGNNGSQGSHQQIARSGLSLVTGHTHSAAITGRLFTTGVSARLDQGYNRGGGSSWCHNHVIVWPSGEAQSINLDFQAIG